jgi:hypothetical protein
MATLCVSVLVFVFYALFQSLIRIIIFTAFLYESPSVIALTVLVGVKNVHKHTSLLHRGTSGG